MKTDQPNNVSGPLTKTGSDSRSGSAPRDTEPMRMNFNDWMWRLTDDRLLNLACVKRLELDIGIGTISFERLD